MLNAQIFRTKVCSKPKHNYKKTFVRKMRAFNDDEIDTFSTGPVEFEAGATYFQPCSDVSRQYVAKEVKNEFMSFFRTTPSPSS